jgi:hypothetical protein
MRHPSKLKCDVGGELLQLAGITDPAFFPSFENSVKLSSAYDGGGFDTKKRIVAPATKAKNV